MTPEKIEALQEALEAIADVSGDQYEGQAPSDNTLAYLEVKLQTALVLVQDERGRRKG